MKSGAFSRALVIGAETFSRLLDWTDRTTCVLFGDGAGAVVLEAQDQPGRPRRSRHPDGAAALRRAPQVEALCGWRPSSTGTVGHLRMEGREVFRHAVAMITDVVEDAFKAAGYGVADIDWFVPHQANKRIIDGSAHKLGIDPAKVITTVDRHGNTSAASIPLALADAVADRRIKRGDLICLRRWAAVLLGGRRSCAGEEVRARPLTVWREANIVDNSKRYDGRWASIAESGAGDDEEDDHAC